MKKKRLLSVVAISAFLSLGVVTLAGCDGDRITQGETYTVNYNQSSDFTVSGLNSSYKEGASVTFTVTVTNSEKEIDTVTVNGSTITGSNGTYSFSMPATNVTIQINLKDKEGPVIEDKVLTATIKNTTIRVGDTINLEVRLDGGLIATGYTVTANDSTLVSIEGTKIIAIKAGNLVLTISYTDTDQKVYTTTVSTTIEESLFGGVATASFTKENMPNLRAAVGSGTYVKTDGISDTINGITFEYGNNITGLSSTTDPYADGYNRLNAIQVKNSNTLSGIAFNGKEVLNVDKIIVNYLTTYESIRNPLKITVGSTEISSPTFSENVTDTGETHESDGKTFSISLMPSVYDFNGVTGNIVIENTPDAKYIQSIEIFAEKGEAVDATAIAFNPTKTTLNAGESIELSATLTPSNATSTISYEITEGSENASITGSTLTGIKSGTATVVAKATNKDGSTIQSSPVTFTIEQAEVTYLKDVKELPEDTEFYSRAYYMGRNSSAYTKNETELYNTVFVGDGTETYSLYSVEANLIDNLGDKLVPGETIIEFKGESTKFGEIFQAKNIEYISIIDADENLTKPEVVTLNNENSDIDLAANLLRKVNVSDAVVSDIATEEANDNYEYKDETYTTTTYTLNVNGKTYEWTLDERYDNYDATIESISIGDTLSFTSFIYSYMDSKTHETSYYFYYVESLEITDEGEDIVPEGITISAESSSIEIGATTTLSATLTPEGATGEVTYEITSGNNYVTLEGNVVTGKAVGSATIVGKVGTLTSEPITITVTQAFEPVVIETGKFGLYQKTIEKRIYIDGKIDAQGRFLTTTESYEDAKLVELTQVSDTTYTLSFEEGENVKYIGAKYEKNNCLTIQDTPYEWGFDAEHNAIITELNNKTLFIGTYDDFNTLSLSETRFIENDGNFIAQIHEKEIELVLPTSVELSAEKTSLNIGETTTISYKTNPEAIDIAPKFRIDNEEVLRFTNDDNLTIFAVSEGTANVIVEFSNGVSSQIQITVSGTHVEGSVNVDYYWKANTGTVNNKVLSFNALGLFDFELNQNTSNTKPNNTYDEFRIYKSFKLTITAASNIAIDKIVFTDVNDKDGTITLDGDNVTFTKDGKTFTISANQEGVTTISFVVTDQIRVESFNFTYHYL